MSDLISRQAAIDTIEERLQTNGYSNVGLVSELNRIIGYLKRLPSAQPDMGEYSDRLWKAAYERGKKEGQSERKNGWWINDKGLYKCSVCNMLWTHWWIATASEDWMYKEMKFCPNCGAKMNKEKENETDAEC